MTTTKTLLLPARTTTKALRPSTDTPSAQPIAQPVRCSPPNTTIHRCACGGLCPSCQAGPPAGASTGEPLAENIRDEFGQRFSHDLSGVRIHTDASANRAARRQRAQAVTVGTDIFFSKDRYSPTSKSGRHLLAHELAHAVQQSPGTASSNSPGRQQEHEADKAASSLDAGRPGSAIRAHSQVGIACSPESLEVSLNPTTLSDDEIRTELREIKLWMAGQIATNDQSVHLEGVEQELLAELTRRHSNRAKADASTKKKNRKKGKTRQTPSAQATPATLPAPRSAVSSFNIEELTQEEQAEELQQMDEWLALTKKNDWRTKEVRRVQGDISGQLARQESAPLLERHNLKIARVRKKKLQYTEHQGLNRYQAIDTLRLHIKIARIEAEYASKVIDLIYEQRNDMRIRSWVSETVGGAEDPEYLLKKWSRAMELIREAEAELAKGHFAAAAYLCNESMGKSNSAAIGVEEYFSDVVSGAEHTVTGLEVVKVVAAATVTIGTGGATGLAVGGLYSGTQSLAQQTSEVVYGLRDKIDWAGVGFDAAIGALSGYLGGKLGNAVLNRLLVNPATASFGVKALSYAVSDYIAGRAGSTIHLTARTAFDLARGKDITWEQFIGQLADQITDPKQAAMDLIMGHASRRATAARQTPEAAHETAPPEPATAPAPAPSPASPAQAYADRFNGRLAHDAGLEGVFQRTANQPTLSVDRRAAAAELRTINDIMTNGYNGQPVTRARVLPPTNAQRTPDLVLEFADGSTTRVEIRAMTSAPKGHSNPHAPLAAATKTRSDPVTQSQLESAITAKARTSPTRPSQLDVPMPGVASGGRIAINITHSPLTSTTADAAIANLTPQLGPHVESISITFRDGNSGVRTTLTYNRQNGSFVR